MYRIVSFSMILMMLIQTGMAQQQENDAPRSKKEIRKARDKYLSLGTGLSYMKVIDNATSPLLYKGFQIGNAYIGYQVHSPERIKHIDVNFGFGWLKTRTKTPWYDPRNTSYRIVIRHDILYRLNTDLLKGKLAWYIGPEININGHFRVNYKYGNSAFTFDNYNGVGLATEMEYPFHWKSRKVKIWFIKFNRRDRDLRLNWQLSTPVVSFMIRPTYVTITNFIDPELQTQISNDQISGGFFVPFNIRSQTSLYYNLHNRNMLKLSYIWNFYHNDPGYNKVQSAYHGWIFSFVYKFNQKPSEQ